MRVRAYAYNRSCPALIGTALILLYAATECGKENEPKGSEPAITEGVCESSNAETVAVDGGAWIDYLTRIGCTADFEALASTPISASLPGARSVKVDLDTTDDNRLYFQNSVLYRIHYDFAAAHLSGNGLLEVPQLSDFNATEYYSPQRRFILGAVTYYEEPKKWAFEIAPYDTASAEMIATLYKAIQKAAFFGPALYFHPTSEAVAAEAENLPSEVRIITTDELYAGIHYQPLTLATGIGRLRFIKAADLATEYLSYQELIVIDQVPNDISVVQGIISQDFQTPLSHVNVLSQNRRTPNMGLHGAMTNKTLRALEGKLVKLTVGATAWKIKEVSKETAQTFWEEHKPEPVTLPDKDLTATDLPDIEDVTPEPTGDQTLRDVIIKAVLAFGGKAAQYSVLAQTKGVPVKKAFAIPIYYYERFMQDNGFYDRLDALLADERFNTDPAFRDDKLRKFREDMLDAPVDETFQKLLKAKIETGYAGSKVRFRTSTNSEDLEAFPCAGCYESHSGDPADWDDVLDAIRLAWSSAWLFRTFEERSYYGVEQKSVSMALLVHNDFPDEEANGVAITGNPYDPSGLDPAFYVNVQYGGFVEVVHPLPGVFSDQFLYYYSEPNQPVTYLSHSNLIEEGSTVLAAKQVHELGVTLSAIHRKFNAAYGTGVGNYGWYAMDVEFKFDDDENPGKPPALYIKQARPYPEPGQ